MVKKNIEKLYKNIWNRPDITSPFNAPQIYNPDLHIIDGVNSGSNAYTHKNDTNMLSNQ